MVDFIDLCIKAFKFFGYVFLIIFAIAIVPYLLLIAVAGVFFMAVIGGAVVLVGSVLSCFTGRDFEYAEMLKNVERYAKKMWTNVSSAVLHFLRVR